MVNFTFIPNHIDIHNCLPFELMPGYTLQKANDIEIETIDNNLGTIGALILSTDQLPYKYSYEFNHISDEEVHVSTEQLKRDFWKYYVVTYQDQGILLSKYQLASNLMDLALSFDLFQFTTFEDHYSFSYTPDLAFRFFADHDLTIKHQITLKNLQDIKWAYEQICSFEGHFHGIMNSIYIFNSLRCLANYNEFKILGLFTVIESLITHKPSQKDPGDSITRQIKNKIPLLFNRMEGGIDYSQKFGKAKEKTIWSKLYDYRSCLSHGKPSDFENDLNLLKSQIVVHDFLIYCIKKLLFLALAEPRLIHDLKSC